jgi:hypothetical protein
MRELHPRDHIDRVAEQELFRGLVTYQSPARILTICDQGGQGKSSLLKRLEYNCEHEFRPPIPSCLVELDKLTEPSPFGFAVTVTSQFTRGAGERFAEFSRLDLARAAKNFEPFEDGGDSLHSRDPRVIARAEAETMYGGENIGMKVEVEHAEKVEVAGRPDFTDDQQRRAKNRCVRAFFDDLRSICATEPMVLLLDGWERCNLDLRDWIFNETIGTEILHDEVHMRPDKLAVIIAGRPHQPGKTPHGLRVDEFSPLFDSDEELSATVLSIKSLSEWTNEHIQQFMVLNGHDEPTDAEVHLIREQLRKGRSLEKILTIIDAIRE